MSYPKEAPNPLNQILREMIDNIEKLVGVIRDQQTQLDLLRDYMYALQDEVQAIETVIGTQDSYNFAKRVHTHRKSET